ncbi:Gamma-tubulin complex component 5 [Tolypocladium ophioglossoides CBS 100239]|uniref:Spindle pole body component n=1 Tax=Tolypocladium ophioglossoides (strain CBS 100239) TaxID=1163406 RepID=A0A0L0NJA4_TOLOC|nr:Gamma-tubulin complex component 5 [Tolypocladium ophioglossoides CBS 100239]
MAFAAQLGTLTEELVEALTQSSSQLRTAPKIFKATCDATLKSLRSQQYLRTNQFEVEHNFNGLEERFRVNHRDDLADALRERVNALQQHSSKWHPEILLLLLELSDQPTLKTRLSDLDASGQGEEEADAALRWEDIAREDGWDQDVNLWETISYSDDSADEELEELLTDESEATSISGDRLAAGRSAEEFTIHLEDRSALDSVLKAQEWRVEAPPEDSSGHTRKIAVSEAQAVREVLFMLQGLKCTLFDHRGSAVPTFQLANTAWETHRALMSTFTEFGRQLSILRRFVSQPQTVPHLQALQDCISRRLRSLDCKLSGIQSRLASPKDEVVVSLMATRGEVLPWLEPLFALSSIIAQVQEAPNLETFHYLELMFNETSMEQLTGRLGTCEFLARIFVECFNVYLRPVRHWMDEGKLLPGNELFFVSEESGNVSLSNTWQGRFKLRKTTDGRLHAPNFLQPAVSKIYNAGKNIVVLRLLGNYGTTLLRQVHDELPLDYDTICPRGFELAPFADRFGAAFDQWVQSKYRKTSTTLKNALFGEWRLSSALDDLRTLYFMSDGSATSSFSRGLFANLDAMKPGWHDRYGLMAAGHEAFASLVDTNRLSVSVDAAGKRLPVAQAQASVKTGLPSVKINYRLQWPVQMIVTDESMAHYQSVFTLLLQIKRAIHTLHKAKILQNYWTDHENWDERALFYASRNRLLWFCTTLQTYLATLVLEPIDDHMRRHLQTAEDVDAMIAVHTSAMKQMVDQACLGSRLAPIREGILDMLDLALRLDHGRTRASGVVGEGGQSYLDMLSEIKADFDRHLRFICGGLRSFARASGNAQSVKWDILADMLQTGDADER